MHRKEFTHGKKLRMEKTYSAHVKETACTPLVTPTLDYINLRPFD